MVTSCGGLGFSGFFCIAMVTVRSTGLKIPRIVGRYLGRMPMVIPSLSIIVWKRALAASCGVLFSKLTSPQRRSVYFTV